MKTINVNVYKFSELSEKAKEKAMDNYRKYFEYFLGDENKATLDAFLKIFYFVKVTDYEYGLDRNNIDYKITIDDEIRDLQGLRLYKWLWNNFQNLIYKGKYYSTQGYYDKENKYHYKSNYSKVIKENSCILTGYCMDDHILSPIYEFLDYKNDKKHNEMTIDDLISDCLHSWLFACRDDVEYRYSDECIMEELENDGECFDENGDRI